MPLAPEQMPPLDMVRYLDHALYCAADGSVGGLSGAAATPGTARKSLAGAAVAGGSGASPLLPPHTPAFQRSSSQGQRYATTHTPALTGAQLSGAASCLRVCARGHVFHGSLTSHCFAVQFCCCVCGVVCACVMCAGARTACDRRCSPPGCVDATPLLPPPLDPLERVPPLATRIDLLRACAVRAPAARRARKGHFRRSLRRRRPCRMRRSSCASTISTTSSASECRRSNSNDISECVTNACAIA